MSINANCIDVFVLPSTSDAAYLKAVRPGILQFSGEKSRYLLEGRLFFPMMHVDSGVRSTLSPSKRQGATILSGKAAHPRHCAMVVTHLVFVQL